MTPILVLDELRKSYGALRVTDGVSLDIAEGEIHAVIGPNGAGKSTLIGEISGAIGTDSGRIIFAGGDVTGLAMAARVQRGIARSFQVTTLLASFTALQNVTLAIQARGGHSFRFFRLADGDAALEKPALELLDRVGLAGRAGQRAGTLSHGEKRLLEVAVALATQPRLLLLDEPMAGVGQEEADVVTTMLKALKGSVTILLVEHDMPTVFALADRISVLVYGRVISTGTPLQIRDDPDVRRAYLGDEAA